MSALLDRIVAASTRVTGSAGRLEKIAHLADALRGLSPPEVRIAVAYLSGDLPQGRIGIGPAAIRAAWPDHAAPSPELTLLEADEGFTTIAGVGGRGSADRRARLLHELFARATRPEQEFLARLLFGELRQGAQEGVMLDAIARAADVSGAEVRRAHMFVGDLPAVAAAALERGSPGLTGFGLHVFRPVHPMLAQSADDVEAALDRLGEAGFEYKLDGARVQVHRQGDDVRVFTRRLNDVTASVPEVVEAVRGMAAGEVVLDGEVIALRPNGTPLPFQVTMRRFGRKLDVARMREELPLAVVFFDCLHIDGTTLIDRPGGERFDALAQSIDARLLVPRIVTDAPTEADRFMDAARAAGHEGLLAKSLAAPYEAGRRGAGWIKVKPANTLDLVVLAAEWGHGRRTGWLSNLHLGARDPSTGGFVMLGKTFKGMTDEILEWQTRVLPTLETHRNDYVVHVRPELVVEIAFNEIQASPRYPGGLALRFARLKAYRPDKRPEEADTIDTVRALYARQTGTAM